MAGRTIEERLERLEAIHEVQNLMGRYAAYHSAGREEERMNLFALSTPGVSAEIAPGGVYEGVEGLKRLFLGAYKARDRTGWLGEHDLTTRIIEVAGDLETAKGVWFCPGVRVQRRDVTAQPATQGELEAGFVWGKYRVDFTKEDGKWKIWHLKWYRTFNAPHGKSWVEVSSGRGEAPVLYGDFPPDRPRTYYKPYDPRGQSELEPPPPEPYETYDA